MTDQFNKCMPIILRNEGGFVNDPVDPGGATKYGISLRFLKATSDLKNFDMDHDGDIDIDDIKLLTVEVGNKVYFEYFWHPLHLDLLKNEDLVLQVFDTAVNAGTKTAVKLLQEVSGCKVDGIIGPKTIAAVNTFSASLSDRFRERRRKFYYDLVNQKPAFSKYIKGWINRCNTTKF